MNRLKHKISSLAKPGGIRGNNDSHNNSLDTTSSMNTAETATNSLTGEVSSEFADCPFLGHRQYAPVSELFKHSLGLVYIARNRETGTPVVIKLIERGASVTRHVASELLLHRRCCNHPFIVHLLDVFLTQRHLAIVLEHMPCGDALELINARGGLAEPDARWIFQQLLLAMAFLHSLGACNRELKLENLLLAYPGEGEGDDATAASNAAVANGPSSTAAPADAAAADAADAAAAGHSGRPTVKLQDFMYSKSEQINSDPQSALGSLPYTAPEVLNNTMDQGVPADVWALGVALFKLVMGIFPFERIEDGLDARRSVQAVLGRIARVDYSIPDGLSPGLRDLLSRMLVSEPAKRITMEDALAHPWVQQDLPPGWVHAATTVSDGAACMSEDALRAVIADAQVTIRPLNSENVDEMADEILNEEEADDLLDELWLG